MEQHTDAAAVAARQLASIARTVGSSLGLDETLEAVAHAVVESLGFRAAVVNLLGPDDELHVVAVAGSEAVRAALEGTHSPLTAWEDLLAASTPWGELRFLSHDVALPGSAADLHFYVPDLFDDGASAGRWHPQDALFAPLVDGQRNLLGVLSVDDPIDGMRPGPVQRAMLEAFAVQASVAIGHARTHAAILESEQLLQRVFDDSPIGKALFDPQGRFERVNRAFCEFLGRSPQELLGHRMIEFAHPEETTMTRSLSQQVREAADGVVRVEKRYLRADGTERWGRLSLTRFGAEDSVCVLAAVADITEARAAEAQLRYLALHDALTGLPNRMLIVDRIEQALTRCRRDGGYVAVIVVDIDHFKLVNDSHGHPVGDQLLVRVASSLRGALRAGDTAGRLGGDEFLVVCDTVASPEDAERLADRLRMAVRVPMDVEGLTLLPSASLGCTVSDGSASADQLVAEADAALYRAKAGGRGRFEMFDDEMRQTARGHMELRAELVTAMQEDQLQLHYQPIIDLATGVTVGYEALLRWQHPTRGLLLPGEFLHAIVDSELDVPVMRWVLHRAGTELHELSRRTPGTPFVSVNLSARQLGRPDLLGDVEQALANTGLEPRRMWLELTEEHLIDSRHRSMLDRLNELGCRIVLDDFGTGYSALTYLQQMPVHVLKIDREFTARVGADRVSAGITSAITDLADVLGITVVAEGVETADQAELLAGMGIGLAQGYFFGRPAPAGQHGRLASVSALPAPRTPVVDGDLPGRTRANSGPSA